MDFLTLARERYSVRKFTEQPVKQEDLDKILAAGHLAPTACNFQPQRVLVLRSGEALEKLKGCTDCHFNAPTALIVCADLERCWKRKFDGKLSSDVDASIVTTLMMMEAQELGVGTTWVMYFDPQKVRRTFGLPDHVDPVAILVMGYPAPDAVPAPLHSQFREKGDIEVYDSF